MIKIIILLAIVIHCIINPSLIGIYCIFGFFGGFIWFMAFLLSANINDTIRVARS